MALTWLSFFHRRLPQQRRHDRRVQSRLRLEQLERRELLDTGTAHFVTGLYFDLLHRQPQVPEVASWMALMDTTGASRGQVASSFLGSGEYQSGVIVNDYQTFLGRSPEAGVVPAWLTAMQQGLTAQPLLASLLSSNEYYQKQGGTNAAWLTGLYRDLLGRQPDVAGLAAWNQALQGGKSRDDVARAFVYSGEADTQLVQAAYRNILGRTADASGLANWSSALSQGLTVEQLAQTLAASQEYFNQQVGVNLPVAQKNNQDVGGGVVDNGNGNGSGGNANGSTIDTNAWPYTIPGNLLIKPTPRTTSSGNTGSPPPGSKLNTPVNGLKSSIDYAEIAMAVDPTNPQHMVIGATVPSDVTQFDTYYTTNGGSTWIRVPLGMGVDGINGANTLRSDPSVAIDANGRIYVAYLVMGQTGDSFMVVLHSTDGGKSYASTSVIRTPPTGPTAAFNDKEILAVGPAPGNPSQQNVYLAWVRFGTMLTNFADIVISGSTDGGVTFSDPFVVASGVVNLNPPFPSIGFNQFANPSVGPNGEIYVTYIRSTIAAAPNNAVVLSGDLLVNMSPTFDRAASSFQFSGEQHILTINNTKGFKVPIPAEPHRTTTFLTISTVDNSSGPNRGRLYVAYADVPSPAAVPENFNIYLVYSDDKGVTWTSPKKVNDDLTSNSHFNPGLAVDPTTGGVSLEWRDARNDPQNQKVDIYTATSADGGVTFGPNVKISDNPSDSSGATSNINDFLEYDGFAAYGGKTYFAWSDNSTRPSHEKSIFFDSHDTGLPILGANPGIGGTLGSGPNRFDPNETSDQAFFFGVLNGTQTEKNLQIRRLSNGLPDNDWFRWTDGLSGTFTVTINYRNNSGDLHLRVFTQNKDNTLVQLGSSRELGVTSQTVKVRATRGEPLLVWVYGFNNAEGDYDITASVQ
jgi:hypothetical protein